MSGESFTINSITSLAAFKKYVEDIYREKKYITFSAPRIGPDRSLDQNALLHVFCTEYAAFLLNKTKKDITSGELDGMKRIAKKKFTSAHPNHYHWMVHKVINPFNGQSKKDYTSSKNWKRGECYIFLTWLQQTAAMDGLVLESKGEFMKNQREELGE